MLQNILSKPQLNHNSTQPQFNITLVGLDIKITLHTNPPAPNPPIETQCLQYISCYLLNLYETLNVSSCEHLIVTVIFVNIRNISAVTDKIFTKFKGVFLGPSLTYAKCQDNIGPGNINKIRHKPTDLMSLSR